MITRIVHFSLRLGLIYWLWTGSRAALVIFAIVVIVSFENFDDAVDRIVCRISEISEAIDDAIDKLPKKEIENGP